MKKKISRILGIGLTIALITSLLVGITALAYDSSLVLENKDPVSWEELDEDNMSGLVLYESEALLFEYALSAEGLKSATDYSLIYYADPWAGDNPGGLVGSGTTDGEGSLAFSGETDTGDLPHPADSNYPDGAKLWLVLSNDYDSEANALTSCNPSDYLYEHNLITYRVGQEIILEEESPDPYEGTAGQFLVILFGEQCFAGFDVVDYKTIPQSLAEPVSIDNGTYRIEIPESTVVSLPGGFRASYFTLESTDPLKFTPSGGIDFSQPVTLSEMVDGEWVEVVSFTSIRSGTPQ